MTPAHDLRLSENFTYEEGTRNRHNIPNVPNEAQLSSMVFQATALLEPLRAIWNKKVMVTSFFRNEIVNRLDGGHPESAHLDGRATDLRVSGIETRKAFEQIRVSNIPYDKLIYETNRYGREWIHIQHNRDRTKPRRRAYESHERFDEKLGKFVRTYTPVK